MVKELQMCGMAFGWLSFIIFHLDWGWAMCYTTSASNGAAYFEWWWWWWLAVRWKKEMLKKKNKNKEKKTDDVVSERGRSLTGNWYHGNVAKGQAKTFQRKKKNTFEKKMNRRITFLRPCCIAREYISQRHPPNFAIAVAGQKQRPYTHEVPGVPAGGIVDFFSFFFQGV